MPAPSTAMRRRYIAMRASFDGPSSSSASRVGAREKSVSMSAYTSTAPASCASSARSASEIFATGASSTSTRSSARSGFTS